MNDSNESLLASIIRNEETLRKIFKALTLDTDLKKGDEGMDYSYLE